LRLKPIVNKQDKCPRYSERHRRLRLAKAGVKPMTVRELIEAMLAAKGASDASPKVVRDLQGGVTSALRTYEGEAVVTVGEGMPRRCTLKS
jgi:hypothetical protein